MHVEGPELEQLKRRAKQQIRQRMRAVRSAIPEAALEIRSAKIRDRLAALPEVASARSIALFWPMPDRGEVNLCELDRELRRKGLRLYYPFMSRPYSSIGGFALVDDPAALAECGRGFLEPSGDAPVAARGDIDVVVVPALAVSEKGHRLGYGAGFYDRVLPEFCPPARSVVVAYAFELLAELPDTPGDVACDVVLTDEHVVDQRRAASAFSPQARQSP
jgi:5-formyltetrahydrofolate cyclo-ligase